MIDVSMVTYENTMKSAQDEHVIIANVLTYTLCLEKNTHSHISMSDVQI